MVFVTPVPGRRILESCELDGHEWQIDPYIGCEHRCQYCYALNGAETDWSKDVLVHVDLATKVAAALDDVEPQSVYLGWNSDPYQPAEAEHGQTRQVLEVLAERGFTACVLTKSDLVTRDIDLLATMPHASVGTSIAFNDEAARERFELSAPALDARLAALRSLREAGIATYALICPVMPGLTEVEPLTERVRPWVNRIWIYRLSIDSVRDRNWMNLERILSRGYPQLVSLYREAAFTGDHPFWWALRRGLQSVARPGEIELRLD